MENKRWTPTDLLQLAGGYWSICALHAAVELDVFTLLAEKKHTAPELAERLNCDIRALAMLLNSLVALELVAKNDECYAVTQFSAEYLSRSSSQYLGYIILHHKNLLPSWSRLAVAVKTGLPDDERIRSGNESEVRENFEMGMYNLAMQIAPKLVPIIDLGKRRSLIDLGGGPGTYAIQFCLHNPKLRAFVYDLPTTRPFAERTIDRFNLEDRVSFLEGDFIIDEIPGKYDVAWLSHVLHGAGTEGASILLSKAVSCLKHRGMILIQEFILDDSMCGPVYPALFSLNMLLGTPNGRSFSQLELFEMLSEAGAKEIRRIPVELPNGAGVISGVV